MLVDFEFSQLEKREDILSAASWVLTRPRNVKEIEIVKTSSRSLNAFRRQQQFLSISYWENYGFNPFTNLLRVANHSTLSSKQWRTPWIRCTTNVKRSFVRQVRRTRRTMAQITCRHFNSRLVSFCCHYFISSFSSSNSLNCFWRNVCATNEWVMNGCWRNANLNLEKKKQKSAAHCS